MCLTLSSFFSSLNHLFLSLYLKKAGLNNNIVKFFDNYHSNRSITYTWNSFISLLFNTSIGVGQGSALFSILSAIYMALIIKKRIKNLKEKIPTDILSFINDSLLISQKKSYNLFSVFLLCSYNIMSKLLLDIGLTIEHNKSKVFHFTRAQNPSINLFSVGGPVLQPKPIW